MFPSQTKITNQITHLLKTHRDTDAAIRPHFFLTGPSGSGKSFLLNQVCSQLGMPFLEINAAQLTAEGLSGNSLSKALRKLREHWNKPNVVFVDEFDKLFQRNGETTEGFRSQVQDEFLTMLESKYASIFTDYGKYEPVVVGNSLFVFAGAFSNQEIHDLAALRETGLRTEFVGRVPLVLHTVAVPEHELREALPKMALFKAYCEHTHESPKTAAKAVMAKLAELNQQADLGIRQLNSAIHLHFMREVL